MFIAIKSSCLYRYLSDAVLCCVCTYAIYLYMKAQTKRQSPRKAVNKYIRLGISNMQIPEKSSNIHIPIYIPVSKYSTSKVRRKRVERDATRTRQCRGPLAPSQDPGTAHSSQQVTVYIDVIYSADDYVSFAKLFAQVVHCDFKD